MDMPLFVDSGAYVSVPLETTYQSEWEHFPMMLKGLLESPPTS